MRSRARRRNNQVSQNLDSFLDILTNTVGVLMFISLFVTLIASGSRPKTKVEIQTPISSPSDKDQLWFEIKNKKVSYLNLRQVREKELEFTGNLPNCNKPVGGGRSSASQNNYDLCLQSIIGRQSNFRTSTKNYDVKTIEQGKSFLFQPSSEDIGETTNQLTAPDSEFNQILSKFNPNQDFVVFIVRPDSFETFRTARKQAWEAGYEIGWEPQPLNLPITIRTILGSELPGGRSVNKQ